MKRPIVLAACWAALVFAQPGAAQQPAPQRRPWGSSSLNAEGKAKALETVKAMQLEPGMTAADVGAGRGVMLPFLSEAVGPSGRVLAQDVDADALNAARETAANAKLGNVTFLTGTKTDPGLPENGVDAVLVRDAYHHFDRYQEMLAGLKKALRPGGRLVIVDYYKRPGAMGGMDAVKHVRADEEQVAKEIQEAGFHLLSRAVLVEGSQYLLVFARD